MRVHIDSNVFFKNIFSDLNLLTYGAIVKVEKVNYNKDDKSLTIPLKRWRLLDIKVKRRLFSIEEYPIYHDNELIDAIIKIKHINNCEIINICPDETIEIIILFGIQFREKEIYISSVEEYNGEPLYQLRSNIDSFYIEFFDSSFRIF